MRQEVNQSITRITGFCLGDGESESPTGGRDAELDLSLLLSCPDAFSRTLLLLSFTELVAEGFPLPQQTDFHSQSKIFIVWLMFTDVCRCIQVCAGVYRCVQVYTGVCRCIKVCAHMCEEYNVISLIV